MELKQATNNERFQLKFNPLTKVNPISLTKGEKTLRLTLKI